MARDHAEAPLDLHALIVRHPAATFFMRMQGDAMAPLIHPGDLLVVDRSLSPRPGHLVVASADGRWVTRRWELLPDASGTSGGVSGRFGSPPRRAPSHTAPHTDRPTREARRPPPDSGAQEVRNIVLRAENPQHAPLHPATLADFQFFGVVTWIARKTG